MATQSAGQWPSQPAGGAFVVTTSDSADLPLFVRAIYVGVVGNVQVTMLNGDIVAFSNVPIGVLPVQCKRIWTTGTTASSIIGLY